MSSTHIATEIIERAISVLREAQRLLDVEAEAFYAAGDNYRGNIRHDSAYRLSLDITTLESGYSHLDAALAKKERGKGERKMSCHHTLRAEDEVPCPVCDGQNRRPDCPGCLACHKGLGKPSETICDGSGYHCSTCNDCGTVPRMVPCPEWGASIAESKGKRCKRCKGAGQVPAALTEIEVFESVGGGWTARSECPYTVSIADTHDAALAATREWR